MELKNTIYEKQGNVAVIKLNRPKALNALNTELLQELETVVSAVEKDEEVRVAVITVKERLLRPARILRP